MKSTHVLNFVKLVIRYSNNIKKILRKNRAKKIERDQVLAYKHRNEKNKGRQGAIIFQHNLILGFLWWRNLLP